ncbi:MAG TPA: polysaccharide biosynthesis/export family protein [Chitinophagaceae bacterium]|nr:polysaccharide biosynthesis/export family protein [Chitinophagaceae bacterium]
MKFTRITALLILSVYFVSCTPQQKLPGYLENIIDTSGKEEVKIPELHIQKNDLLSIQVYSLSTLPEKSDLIYNLPCNGASGGSSASSVCGFMVDVNGNIEYPRLGIFHAEGLTKLELAEQIKKKLTEPIVLLASPNVIIRFLNFKVTVLGEVAHPQTIPVPGERITILEAIGLSGDITPSGRKNSVKVIREVNNKREIGMIDLSKKPFESPYYNLMQNDVVIVEPSEQKAKQTDMALVQQRVGFAISIISSIAVIYSIIKN